MSQNKTPVLLEELTAEWLQKVLSPHFEGESIVGFSKEIIGVGEGFMGQLARISLTYDRDQSTAPKTIIAKFAAVRQDTRDMAADRNLYKREIGFYRDIGNKSGVPIPECYYADYFEEKNQFVLLIEDLAPGEPSNQIEGTDRATSKKVLKTKGS